MDGDPRMHPSSLLVWIATPKYLNKFRYRISDIGRKRRKEGRGGLVFIVVAEKPRGRSAHSSRIDVAIALTDRDYLAVKCMSNKGIWWKISVVVARGESARHILRCHRR